MKEETFQERLLKLCKQYDEIKGEWPEHMYEGKALYQFYLQNKEKK